MRPQDHTEAARVDSIINSLQAENKRLQDALIEATAELIYLRKYGKDGALWWANDSKDVWRGMAIAGLAMGR